VIYSCVRPYLLNIAIVESDIMPPPIASTAFAVLNGFGLVLPKYQWIVLRSPVMVQCVEEKMRGQAYPAINDSDFARLPFPLPPLPEQHRIVAKVDELMRLCDQLETQQATQSEAHERLVTMLLDTLTQSADAEAFAENWSRIAEHFDLLFDTPESVGRLKQAILRLAVQGKLVPQDPSDEPVISLLRRIRGKPGDHISGVSIDNKDALVSCPNNP